MKKSPVLLALFLVSLAILFRCGMLLAADPPTYDCNNGCSESDACSYIDQFTSDCYTVWFPWPTCTVCCDGGSTSGCHTAPNTAPCVETGYSVYYQWDVNPNGCSYCIYCDYNEPNYCDENQGAYDMPTSSLDYKYCNGT